MASSYSTNLAIELIGTGDQAGTWGVTTNTNLGTLIEQAISGYVTQAVSTGGDTTITIPNGATGVARNMYIELTGTGGAATNLIVPSNKKLYFIFNNTASGQVTVKVSGQTGVSVPNGAKMILVSNGTDIVDATNYVGNISAASGNITVLTSASATITNLLATSLTVSSGSTLNGGVVVNELGADVDFRVEGDADANLLFVDASTDRVGVGTDTPSGKLHVTAASGATGIFNSTNNEPYIRFDQSGAAKFYIGESNAVGGGGAGFYDLYGAAGVGIRFYTAAAERLRLDTSGNLGLGVTPSAWEAGGALQLGTTASNSYSYSRRGLTNNSYFDGSNWRYYASAGASLYQPVGAVHAWYSAPSGTAGNAITFTQAMTLDASGNLLVGRTTASGLAGLQLGTSSSGKNITLHGSVDGNDGLLQFIDKNDASSLQIGGHSTEVYLYGYGSRPMIFFTNGTARARIASGGQFCINTTNTSGALNVDGELYLFNLASGAGNSTLKYNSGTGQVTYDASSRLVKENIVDSTYGLAEVLQLKSRKYFRKDDQREEIGFVADEVQEVLPEFVPMAPKSVFTGNEEDTELVPSAVNYDKLTSVLVKAIQEQQAMIEDLKAKVAALEAK
jgi:hypothetical protein